MPQASLDIARYIESAPDNLAYDHSAREYVASPAFKPRFPRSSAARFLHDLLASAEGVLAPAELFSGAVAHTGVMPLVSALPEATVLAHVLQAIREGYGVETRIQTEARPAPVPLTFSPHALLHDGRHWMVRAWSHEERGFRSLALARMQGATLVDGESPGQAEDNGWSRTVEVVLVANSKLSRAQRRLVEIDHGLADGSVTLVVRQCLLGALLRHLGLHKPDDGPGEPNALAVRNRKTVDAALAAV